MSTIGHHGVVHLSYEDADAMRVELASHVGEVVAITTFAGESQDYVVLGLEGLELVLTRWPERARQVRLRLDDVVHVHIW